MKRLLITATIVLAGSTAFAQLTDHTQAQITLPSLTAIRVEKTIYQYESSPQLMGDGHRVNVVQTNPDDLRKFIDTNIPLDPDWAYGSMRKLKLYLDILEWMEPLLRSELKNVLTLADLKEEGNLYLRAEYRRNSDGFFTDATLWIIRPELRQIIMLNLNT